MARVAQHALKVGGFLLRDGAHVSARRGACAPQRDDLPDLRQRQPKAPSLPEPPARIPRLSTSPSGASLVWGRVSGDGLQLQFR